jgi:ABC-type branched-subunit amino acid transport system substrate-binding protein
MELLKYCVYLNPGLQAIFLCISDKYKRNYIMEKQENKFLSRRGMLKSFGLAGAAVVAAPALRLGESALQAATQPFSSAKGSRVGILFPDSSISGFTGGFLSGFNMPLRNGWKAGEFIEKVGKGECLTGKLDEMIRKNNPSVVVGVLNTRQAASLTDIVNKAGITFIEANLGENFFHKDYSSDKFYHVSLNLWQAHYVLGQYAANHNGKRAVCASSFFDSGYDLLYAFIAGFESAGGKVIDTLISGSPSNNISPVETAALAATAEADIIFANFSDSDGGLFLNALKYSSGIESKKIFTSSMMVQPRLAKHIGDSIVGVTSASTWSADSSQQSAEFAAEFFKTYKIMPNDFNVLGYEAALAADKALSGALSGSSLNSARGAMKFNAGTNGSETPVFILEMARPDDAHIISKVELPNAITNADFKLIDKNRTGAMMAYPAR